MSKRRNVYMFDDDEKLFQQAKAQGLSISQVLREALQTKLKPIGEEPDFSKATKFLANVRKFSSDKYVIFRLDYMRAHFSGFEDEVFEICQDLIDWYKEIGHIDRSLRIVDLMDFMNFGIRKFNFTRQHWPLAWHFVTHYKGPETIPDLCYSCQLKKEIEFARNSDGKLFCYACWKQYREEKKDVATQEEEMEYADEDIGFWIDSKLDEITKGA